eukprot:165330_1
MSTQSRQSQSVSSEFETNKRWTSDDEDILFELHYEGKSYKDIAILLNRSEEDIKQKLGADVIGVLRNKKNYKINDENLDTNKVNKYWHKWTDKEDEEIVKLSAVLQSQTGRTFGSICSRLQKIKNKKHESKLDNDENTNNKMTPVSFYKPQKDINNEFEYEFDDDDTESEDDAIHITHKKKQNVKYCDYIESENEFDDDYNVEKKKKKKKVKPKKRKLKSKENNKNKRRKLNNVNNNVNNNVDNGTREVRIIPQTTNDCLTYMYLIGYGKYVNDIEGKFRENLICGTKDLLCLDKQDWFEFGVKSLFDRKKIIQQIKDDFGHS